MRKKSQLTLAKESRQEAEHKLAVITAQTESRAMERALSLLESPQPVVVPWSEYPAFDQFGQFAAYERPYYFTSIDDRSEGRYRPLYETADDLKRMRADARRLKALFPICSGAMKSLTNYVIGNGFEFTAQNEAGNAPALCNLVQAVIDSIIEHNDFSGCLDREIFTQSYTDGECLPTLYVKDQRVVIELTQADYILQPTQSRDLERWLKIGHKLNYWWHGVHTSFCPTLKRDDVQRPHGYHVVFDRTGDEWDYLPTERVEHIKRNVGLDARRGVSDFYIVLKDFEQEAKIRHNTAVGAAILAAIVMIRQHAEGVSKSSIESMVSTNSTSNYQKSTQDGSRTTYSEQLRPGTIKDTPSGMTATLGPLGQMKSPVYIQVAQDLRRIIGHCLGNMPEYLISGDASNANYASTLVAESPFIKYCEFEQERYAKHFERLLWKALALYHRAGKFGGVSWELLRSLITLKVDYTSPASRDKLQQAQANQIMHDAGVLSKRSWQTDAGLDPDEEEDQIALEPAKPAPVIASPFGHPFGQQPGQPGGQQPQQPTKRLEAMAANALKRLSESRAAK